MLWLALFSPLIVLVPLAFYMDRKKEQATRNLIRKIIELNKIKHCTTSLSFFQVEMDHQITNNSSHIKKHLD